MTRPYDVITFDCYGTLIDWETGIWSAFRDAAAQDGVTLDRARVLALYAVAEPEVEAETFRSYANVLAATARRVAYACSWVPRAASAHFLSESLPAWSPFADTGAALVRLRDAGYRLGILSNVDDALIARTVENFPVHIDFIVSAEQVRSYKPALAHWHTARARVGANARWLHAAQSYFHDIAPARTLGLPTAWVNRKHEAAPDGGRATIEVHSLAELADALGA